MATFAGIATNARASRNAAYSWVVRAALAAGFILGVTQAGTNIGGICVGPIIGALFSLLLFAFTVGLSQSEAKAFGGSGTYDALAFASAAYFAPTMLIGSALSMFPYGHLLGIPLLFYHLFLNAVAVKAVHRLSWVQASVPSAVLVVLNVIVAACVLMAILGFDPQQAGM